MADTFDPYYNWLAIPPEEQPPNHYRLIGVTTLEANLDAISHACDQRMAHLRTFQSGKHAAASQKLLNEISAASVVLLNADKKSVYDEQLRRQLAPHNVKPQPKSLPKAKSLPVAAELTAKPAPAKPAPMPTALPMRAAPVVASALEPVAAKALWQQPLVLVSAGGGLALLAAAIGGVLFFAGAENPTSPTSKGIAQRPATIGPAGKAPAVAQSKPATQQGPRTNEAFETSKSSSVGIPSTSPTGSESAIPSVAIPEVPPSPTGSPTPTGENIASADKPDGGYAVRPVDTSGTLALALGAENEPVAVNEETVAKPKETTGTTNAGAARIKVPDAAAQKKAKDELREILKADFEKALKPDAKLSLSNKLQRLAKETPDDPAARYVLLNDAFQLAVEASQAQRAFTLADEIASEFEVEAWQLKGDALKQLSPLARTPAERQQVAEAALKIADEAVAQANYAMADQLLKIAATRVVDPKLKTTIMVRAKEIDDLQKQAKLAKLAEERLKTDPDNPAANLAYGKYLCYLRGQWEQGLPYLAKGDDAALKSAATGDIAAPTTPEKRVALGDLWWDAAQANKTADKHGLLARAGYWYGQALSGTTGISKARLEKRLVEIKESVPASTVAANTIKSKAINLIALIDPKEDTVKGDWLIERGTLVCATQHFVPKLYLPYIPPEEYDLKVVFSQPKIRHDIGIILPRGANSFSWQAGGTEGKFLFSVDDRVSGGKNPTESRFPGAILPGRQYTTVVQVRNEGVIAFFEGKQMAAYKTDYRDLRVDSWHVLPDPSRMAVCCDDPTVFHVIELTEVTGKGNKVREGSK